MPFNLLCQNFQDMGRINKMINLFIRVNITQSLIYSITRCTGGGIKHNAILFYNRNVIKVHNTAKIVLKKGNFHFGLSSYKEPFPGMLEMKKDATYSFTAHLYCAKVCIALLQRTRLLN